jgi:hypothetical protein
VNDRVVTKRPSEEGRPERQRNVITVGRENYHFSRGHAETLPAGHQSMSRLVGLRSSMQGLHRRGEG